MTAFTSASLRSVFSGFVLFFCVSFVCLLPATSALLAKFGLSWFAAPEQVGKFLMLFLGLNAMSFLWSYRLHRKRLPCAVGLAALLLVFVGHELLANLAVFYSGIGALLVASVLNWRARAPEAAVSKP